MRRHRILIVDDHVVVREGLRAILSADPDLHVVGEAADGDEACTQAAEVRPDIVIMDLSMPGVNGTEATRRVLAVSPDSRIVILSAHEESAYVREALAVGARAYVLKRAVLQDLLRAVHVVIEGGVFLDSGLALRSAKAAPVAGADMAADLSSREVDVASLAAQGHSNAEIAGELKISVKTVETHKTRLMVKLGLQTRAQLVRYAIYRGWLRG